MNRNNLSNMALTVDLLLLPTVLLATTGDMRSSGPDIRFVGNAETVGFETAEFTSLRHSEHFALSYMTAAEMKQKVRAVTGFLHSDFDTFADVLGRWDPRSGTRTSDRPSLVSFLFIKRISANVAQAVLKREVFLDPEERTVFRHTDFSASPTDDELANVVTGLFESWLTTAIDAESLQELTDEFRLQENTAGQIAAYQWLVETLMQHGGLYYY